MGQNEQSYCRPLAGARARDWNTDSAQSTKDESELPEDKACLKKDWVRHKFVCRLGRRLDELDDFIRACHEEIIPTDDDVAEAFGFLFFTSAVDRQRLFRLYCDLINQWGVSEEELRQAWKPDKLKRNDPVSRITGSQ